MAANGIAAVIIRFPRTRWTRRAKDKATKWRTLREIAACDDAITRLLEKAAQAPRHGDPEVVPEADAVKLLTTAWTIADGYILNY